MLWTIITLLCLAEGVEEKYVKAILKVENPTYSFTITHKNKNGTTDKGLFQLNSKYLDEFVERYWVDEKEAFDWSNPYHNATVAVRYIAWLRSKGLSWWYTVACYNAGYSARHALPRSARMYADRVLKIGERL